MSEFIDGFLSEPIGGTNPYYRCKHCKISVPEINYTLKGHSKDCIFRICKENGFQYPPESEQYE